MLKTRLRSLWAASIDPPYLPSILVGFAISYVFFFLIPIFLSAPGMQFPQYIPAISPIGVDLKQVLNSTKSWLGGSTPYFQFNLYPPLAYLLVRPLLFLPLEWRYRVITLATLAAYGLSVLAIAPGLSPARRLSRLPMLVLVTGLLSYGFQFELERGQFNLLAVTLSLLAIWIYHRRPARRWLAYVLFSLSVQLKLYPLIFVVMFIDDWRDWTHNIRRVTGLCLANFALFFVLGPGIFVDFLRAIRVESASPRWIWVGDHAIHSFVSMLLARAPQAGWPWRPSYEAWVIAGLTLAVLACIFLILRQAYRQRAQGVSPHLLLACALGACLLPSISNDYKLSTLAAPVALLLGSLEASPPGVGVGNGPWRGGFSAVALFAFAAAYSSTLFSYTNKPNALLIANACPALLIMLAAVSVLALASRPPREPAQPAAQVAPEPAASPQPDQPVSEE